MESDIHILLVEDSPADVLLTEEALSTGRFQIQNSARLGDALLQLKSKRFDVILLDLGLPDSQGLDTLRAIRDNHSQIAVVVLTGQNDEQLALQSLKEGAQDYLMKGEIQAGLLQRGIRYAVERVGFERKLRESEEQLHEITNHIDQVLWIIDAAESKVLYVSPAYEKVWGRSVQSLFDNPRSYLEGIHPLDREMMEQHNRAMYQTGQLNVECRILRPDGSIRWVWARGYPVKVDGEIVRVVGMIEDISDQRLLTAERDILLSRLQLHIERMPLAYLLFNENFRITDWNPAAQKMFEYNRAEALGKSAHDFYPESFREEAARIIARLRAGDMEAHSINDNLTKSDKTITCEWFNTPLMSADGQFTGLLSLVADVTRRKKMEERYRQSEKRLKHVVASSPAVLFTLVLDEERILGIGWISDNLTEMFGHPVEAAQGTNWWMANVHPEDRERITAAAHTDLFGKGRSVYEYRFRCGDGSYRWIRNELLLIRDSAGHSLEAVGSWTDITERKQLEDQFHQAQKMEAVGQLAGGVAHDFNNLLTIISGYSQLLISKLDANDPMLESVKAISDAGERAGLLTRQLLAFSRKTVLEPKVLKLNEIVRETEKILRRLIGEDIVLTSVLDPAIRLVKVDPGQVGQVLINLAVNARDAMPKGGQMTIETRNVQLDQDYIRLHHEVKPGEYVLLSVSDTGTGMTAEVKARIFEPFFTTKEVGKGTGLGLAVVLGIVKQSGGHVEVYTEPGVGSSFKIYFPAVDEDISSPVKEIAPRNDGRGTETILLVEDEPSLRVLAEFVLRTHGYTVLTAGDGAEALRLAKEQTAGIDLLLTDVVMPIMGGPDLAAALQPLFPQMKVLFSSGYTDDAVVRHGLLHEKFAFLRKPYTPLALARKVRDLLDGR